MMQTQTGRVMWTLLHAFALAYPETPSEQDKERAKFWMLIFSECVNDASVSCERCSKEWKDILTERKPDFSCKAAFYEWTIAAHDRVNVARGKAVFHPSISLKHPLFKGYAR